MSKKIIIPLLLASLLAIVTGCGTKTSQGSPVLSSDVEFGKSDYKKIAAATNELGFKLLSEIEEDKNDNLFISPTSALMALAMVYNGADGVTKEEIAATLQVEGIDVTELNKANASMLTILHKDSKKLQLNVANSIWINERFHFQDEFAQSNKNYFNAEIEEIDISNNDSPKRINNWVKKATNEKIEEIVDTPLDPDLVAILINAIYFKGDWKYEFDKKQTEEHAFHLKDGTTKDIPLMVVKEELAYMENESFQAVKLPYGDEEMSMTIILPRDNVQFDEFKKTLTNDNWIKWKSAFSKKEGTVLLPKFQLEFEALLNEPLKRLGMKSAFAKGADFSKIIKENDPLWISKVKQKTFIEVNEEGTEAAAVTSVEVVTESASENQIYPFHMVVNRPFFLTITDDLTNTNLFMGWISNPQEGK